jgi:steroid delta-isomerase-like uncharacterized protein
MSAEDNVKTARKCYELFNSNKLDQSAAYAAPDAVWQMIPTQETYNGPAGFEEATRKLKEIYRDLKVKITSEIASDNYVVCEIHSTGTHTGTIHTPQGDIPPTNKRVEMDIVDVWEFRHGKVTGIRSYFDSAAMVPQTGRQSKAA